MGGLPDGESRPSDPEAAEKVPSSRIGGAGSTQTTPPTRLRTFSTNHGRGSDTRHKTPPLGPGFQGPEAPKSKRGRISPRTLALRLDRRRNHSGGHRGERTLQGMAMTRAVASERRLRGANGSHGARFDVARTWPRHWRPPRAPRSPCHDPDAPGPEVAVSGRRGHRTGDERPGPRGGAGRPCGHGGPPSRPDGSCGRVGCLRDGPRPP